MKALRPILAVLCVFLLGACAVRDGWQLTTVAVRDLRPNLPLARAGYHDVSRLGDEGRPGKVLEVPGDPVKAEKELREFLAEARGKQVAVSIAGARHSMGGQTLGQAGDYVVDMLGLNHVRPLVDDPQTSGGKLMIVGGGARWKGIIPVLAAQGDAPKVMQSNSDFSVGGSLSVNCHGWQHNSPPIVGTVRALRVMTADGRVRECSRWLQRSRCGGMRSG
ncbi:MAG TPA: FAD-dependent oxidoreductase [Prosthecobacter sp.]|nr:FAD-dependent oxidoreductase [Prosthecobacter sp.]